jgi:hypothetical protein
MPGNDAEGSLAHSEGDFVPLPTVVARLTARSFLPPPNSQDGAGEARARTSVTEVQSTRKTRSDVSSAIFVRPQSPIAVWIS